MKAGALHVAVFELWAGGNACGAWPAIVIVDSAGKVSVDTRFADECRVFSIATETDAIVLVQRAFPWEDGAVWRVADDGVRRLGKLVFEPQPGTTWVDLDKALDHPTSLFDIAPVDAAVRSLVGQGYAEFASSLSVASGVERRGRYLIGTGCQPHSCTIIEGFIAVDRDAKQVYLGYKNEGRVTTWPALARWPNALRREFESWRNG